MDDNVKKCPNCSQPYQLLSLMHTPKAHINIPLFLSCGHSMCEKCLSNIVKFGEPIECKICHRDMEVDVADVALLVKNKKRLYDLFPVNVHMLGELALQTLENPQGVAKNVDDNYFIDLKSLLKNNENNQGQCLECNNATLKMCRQCATILCDACFTRSHKNFVIFKNHVLQNIETHLERNNCKIHKEKPLDYYCKDCSKSICMDCMMVGGEKSCKSHNVASLQEVNEGFLEELCEVAPKVDETFKRLTKTAVDIGHLLYNIENQTGSSSELTQIVANTEQHFSKLCYIVQKHKKEVIDTIMKLKSSEKESLKKAKDFVEKSIEQANKVMKMIKLSSDPQKLKQINVSVLLEDAKQITEIPWYLNRDETKKDPLKVAVNEDLCALIIDYVHLEGNANSLYKLHTTSELPDDIEIPPPPHAPVYPPELPKDVRQFNKPKVEKEKFKKGNELSFYKAAPTYRSKSGSVSSLNSCSSDGSYINYVTQGDTYQKPAVQPVPPFAESQHPKQLQEGSQELIYISHIVDPHNFYVQRACHQDMVKAMLREFRNAVSLPKPSISHASEGKIYLAFNKADNMWQRCRVVSIDRRIADKPIFHVFCTDFGSTETVSIDNLRLLPPAWVQSPYPLAINCSLANCQPKSGTWTNDDAFLMQNIIDNKQAVIHIRHIRSTSNYTVKLECDVTTFENSVSVAHALVFHDRARMSNPKLPYPVPAGLREKPKIFMNNNDLKYKAIEEVYITHIVNPDKFFVRKRHLQNVYEKLCEDLEQEYSSRVQTGTIYLPEIGMVCVVNVEKCRASAEAAGVAGAGAGAVGGAWERGVVTEWAGRARVRVSLTDTGELLLVHYSALRHIHHKFTTCAALVSECHLAGVTPLNKKWSPGSVALLQKFENHLLELHVEDNRNRNSIGVTLYNKADEENEICINREMIKYKFAVTFGLFKFNKNTDIEDQVITNKSPLDVPTRRSNVRNEKITILKRHPPKQIEEDLEAKDKGPLRLEAKVLHYQSPSLLYVSLVHQQKTFNKLFENMQTYYTKNKINAKDQWEVGERCCTICIQSQTWRRAVILELEGENAKVFYSDFACIETVPVSSLRESTDFTSIGDAAIKCHLCGVVPAVGEEWPSLTKEYLGELLDAYKRVFITKLGNFKNKSMPVELWVYHTTQGGALEPNQSEWRCLNKKIIDQGLGIPDKSQEVTKPENERDDDMLSFLNVTGSVRDWLQLEPLPTKPLTNNPGNDSTCSTPVESEDLEDIPDDQPNSSEVIFISDWLPPEPLPCKEFTAMPTYIDNDGVIYLHDVSQNDTLELIRKALDVRFSKPDPKAKFAKWTVNEPCVALFFLDNRFYRGRILEVNKEASTCLVHYIDYGNEEICSFANLRKSIALHQIPTQAHKCILNRIVPISKQWDRQALDYIHKSIVEKQCYVKVAGEKIGDLVPVELKYDKLWINDHLVDFEMAVYEDGSKAVVRKFAPCTTKTKVEKSIVIDSDSGPDYIVEEDQDSADSVATSQESFDINSIKGKDWNKLLEEEKSESDDTLEGNYFTYPNVSEDEFKCNVCVINDPNVLELSVIHNDETNILYDEMLKEVQDEGGNMPALNGIFKNKACIALFPEDGLWYRACILEYSTTKNKIKVKYIDYGNIEVISLADVREIEKQWTQLPPTTISTKLYGLKLNPDVETSVIIQECTNTLLDKGPFDAKIIFYEDSLPHVEIRNENEELINDILTKNQVFMKYEPTAD